MHRAERKPDKAVVLTGAGISAPSGLATFSSAGALQSEGA